MSVRGPEPEVAAHNEMVILPGPVGNIAQHEQAIVQSSATVSWHDLQALAAGDRSS
jgi:hypothetical protein